MTHPTSDQNLDGSNWDESNWREDYLNTKQRLSQFQIKLLKEGPSSFGEALYLGAMKTQWLKMRGLYKPLEQNNE